MTGPEKLKIRPALVVEGKYDKIRLSSLVDAMIIETGGFGIFRDTERMKLIRAAAAARGVVILTDSDAAGFKIRAYLSGCLPKDQVRHAYIPDVYGRERRREKASSEGKLGVEGMTTRALTDALRRAGALEPDAPPPAQAVDRMDFYTLGLSGHANSRELRRRLASTLGLPARISAGALLEAVNLCLDKQEFTAVMDGLCSAGREDANIGKT